MAKKLISICIPVMNEVNCIDAIIRELQIVTKNIKKYNFEYVFSDNFSTDGTWQKIIQHSKQNKKIRGIKFSKDIGYQNSILQNYYYSLGEAMIQLDADLQDPPSMIKNFLFEWENGYKIVYGIRNIRKGSKIDSIFRRSGYKVLSWATNDALHNNVGDFKLIDRTVVDVLKKRNYVNPYLRGIISSLGFKEKGIVYERGVRKVGRSKISIGKSLKLGLIGLASFSTKPIRVFIPISILFTLLSIIGILWVLFLNIIGSDLPRGFSFTQIFIFVSIGLNSMFAAIAGDYLHKIYKAIHPTTEGYISESI